MLRFRLQQLVTHRLCIHLFSGVRIEGMEEIPCGFAVFDKSLYTTDLARANVIWTIVTIVILETALVKDAYGWAEFPGKILI